MSTTFLEMFDEKEREELLLAVIAQKTAMKGRIKAANNREKSPNEATIGRLEIRLHRLEVIQKTISEESF